MLVNSPTHKPEWPSGLLCCFSEKENLIVLLRNTISKLETMKRKIYPIEKILDPKDRTLSLL